MWFAAAAAAFGAVAALVVANLTGWFIAAPRVIGAVAAGAVTCAVLAWNAQRAESDAARTPPTMLALRAAGWFALGLLGAIVLILLLVVLMLLIPGIDGPGAYN